MPAALFCLVDPAREADRRRLRADHLAYIAAHRGNIVAGGPTIAASGAPETMILLVDLDPEQARAFIAAEPYTAHGVFARVEVKAWARVLPEPHPGTLDEALAAERALTQNPG